MIKYQMIGTTQAARRVDKPTFQVLKGKEILYSGKSINKAHEIATENNRKVYACIWGTYYDVVCDCTQG